MGIERANYMKGGKGTQKTHYLFDITIDTKLKIQTNPTCYQHLKNTYHHNTWAQG